MNKGNTRLCQLSWLRGPGKSIDENFEIMMLELLKTKFPEGGHFRVAPPDGGIDIIGEEYIDGDKYDARMAHRTPYRQKVAYQCKAYSIYRHDLVRSINRSLEKAVKGKASGQSLQWDKFTLIIPLLLTLKQRTCIESAWKNYGLEPSILDIDTIETQLFVYDDVRTRFFPDFGLLLPAGRKPIQVGFPDQSETVEISIFLHRFQQDVRMKVPLDIPVAGFLCILVEQLSLPTIVKFDFGGERSVVLQWNLVPYGKQLCDRLDGNKSFRELKIIDGSKYELYTSDAIIRATMHWGIPPDSGPDEYCDKSGWHEFPQKGTIQNCLNELIRSRLSKLVVRADPNPDRREA